MEGLSHNQTRTALVLYGSETGNAQDVAEELGRLTERLRFVTRVTELNEISISDLIQYSIVIFAISTTGQGDLPKNSLKFWKRIRSIRLVPGALADVSFASFGLGDSSYPKFNWAHRKLHNRLRQLGADSVCERGESDEQHPEGIEGCFLPWSFILRSALLEKFPLPLSQPPIPEKNFLPPKWAIEICDGNGSLSHSSSSISDGESEVLKSNAKQNNFLESNSSHINDSGKFVATLLKNERLTPLDHWQDVRLFEFSCPPLDYQPGDVLTIFPRNSSEDVEEFLSLMEWQSFAHVPLKFVPNQAQQYSLVVYPPEPIHVNKGKPPLTLRKLLTEYLDITAIPRRSFFASIAHFTEDETQKERLIEFTDPQYVDELYDYTTRPRRSILEVLQEFGTVKIPFKWAASVLPHIRGRQFSIASGGKNKFADDGSGRIELLVAVVKYKTVIKKIRQGLCTKYLISLNPGVELEVLFCKGGMRHDFSRSAVMIGPGTGVAPLRALMLERAWKIPTGHGPHLRHLLFFGGRNRHADFFFENEWTDLSSSTGLEIFPAFSRDQRSKIYVQDLIRKQSSDVYQALLGGMVYVCGSSGKMPQAVREALIDVMRDEGKVDRSEAESQLALMEKEGRYQQETW